MPIPFTILDPRYDHEALGLIPHFLSEESPLSASAQFMHNYRHGGGWSPMKGWSMGPVGEILYAGGEVLQPIAIATLHNSEIIRVYPHAWVSIAQVDGSFEVSRMD
jgi:hypothetical protein